jgi:hypothetical protein
MSRKANELREHYSLVAYPDQIQHLVFRIKTGTPAQFGDQTYDPPRLRDTKAGQAGAGEAGEVTNLLEASRSLVPPWARPFSKSWNIRVVPTGRSIVNPIIRYDQG